MSSDLSFKPDTTSLFCIGRYEDKTAMWIRNTAACGLLLSLLVLIIKYIKRRHHSPIRERAALLSIVQMFGFWCFFLIQYITEIIIMTTDKDTAWSPDCEGDTSNCEAKKWRSLIKSVYMATRIVTYFLFIVRYLRVSQSEHHLHELEESHSSWTEEQESCAVVSLETDCSR